MMTSTMALALILLAVLIGSFYYIVQAEGGWGELPRLMERVGIKIDQIQMPKSKLPIDDGAKLPSSLPEDYVSGKSRFSRGICVKDSDCYVGGCSGEVCGNEEGMGTTCEYSEDFPSEIKFECACVAKACGWRTK
ncbi:MAG: hypothetical protein A3G57_04945 [Candidatus Andersenbacteria bacterium RIFCSPLOWO2_12_FULL_45_8]|nr:MAG: hypothetical protein A3B76_03370 [Candidatus Andersenbacteria bacterium RIFCSPHIGHO2_02_FULL_46_16]OGY39984.1 MAG: hypothetical protein A3G57_04945 [Candidatus Andersenbacteria bacterium RIFCSPLOWO2_12_FULL_45_8]HBE89749.1 hypothetical protein [Candidatus Andersenbacteria bacterium]